MSTKTAFKSILFMAILFSIVSCSKKTDNNKVSQSTNLETETFKNLYAPQTGGHGQPTGGVFTKFSFSTGSIVTDDNWDIAFRGTTIIVNGGTSIGITDEPLRTGIGAVSSVNNTLDAVKSVPEASTFKQDQKNEYAIPTGSDNGWYHYNSTQNLILPIAGKVFVVKTHDGKYAKFEIISYYKDAPITPDATSEGRYYTFRFVYQPNGIIF